MALSKEIVMDTVDTEKVIELGKVSEETKGMEQGSAEGTAPFTAFGG